MPAGSEGQGSSSPAGALVDLIEKLASECTPELSHDIGRIAEGDTEDEHLSHRMEGLAMSPMAVSVS